MDLCDAAKRIMNKHPPHLLGTQNLPIHIKTYDSPETLAETSGNLWASSLNPLPNSDNFPGFSL